MVDQNQNKGKYKRDPVFKQQPPLCVFIPSKLLVRRLIRGLVKVTDSSSEKGLREFGFLRTPT